MPYDPEQWHDFATSFAGAAGALLGLAFVAVSFNLNSILQDKTLPGRAIETLVFFAYPLAGSLLIQLPGLSRTALGTCEAILAAGIIGLAAAIDVPRWQQERHNPLSWRLGHIAPAVVIALLTIVGAQPPSRPALVACTGWPPPWPSLPPQGSSTAGSCLSRSSADP